MNLIPERTEFTLPSKNRVKVLEHQPGMDVQCVYIWMSGAKVGKRAGDQYVDFDPLWLVRYGIRHSDTEVRAAEAARAQMRA